MDLFDAICKRHSYRGEFEPAPVPREHLRQIVDAGIRAPSGCNAQTTKFVIVDDPGILKSIAQVADRPFTRSAPAMIVCAAEHRVVYGTWSFAVEDCAASVENMLLAVSALRYASVWLDGMLRKDGIAAAVAGILAIPSGYEVRVLLPVGIPKSVCVQRDRLPFEARASFNRWSV